MALLPIRPGDLRPGKRETDPEALFKSRRSRRRDRPLAGGIFSKGNHRSYLRELRSLGGGQELGLEPARI